MVDPERIAALVALLESARLAQPVTVQSGFMTAKAMDYHVPQELAFLGVNMEERAAAIQTAKAAKIEMLPGDEKIWRNAGQKQFWTLHNATIDIDLAFLAALT